MIHLDKSDFIPRVHHLKSELYGSLALTGKGHGTDLAILLGLEGETPEDVDPDTIKDKIEKIRQSQHIHLAGKQLIIFQEPEHLIFHHDKSLPFHPNGMRFTAYDAAGKELLSEVWYSVGGGFIVDHKTASQDKHLGENNHLLPYHFTTANHLLSICRKHGFSIAKLMLENEKTWRSETEVREGLLHIWSIMRACIDRGCSTEGLLPGGLQVKRRARGILLSLMHENKVKHPADLFEWISLWALAVNEENAAGGRVVTAPTNGAAGVIPAVLNYFTHYCAGANDDGIINFLLVAGAMGILYKEGASISAAEMGCMGEVGVACSMAAAGLTAALGGSNEQVENAAEIGMEHNLGLTCDPIMGLVQIPCIERNTMGAIKAVNASLLALKGDGTHRVSLDQVIATMRQTGHDMKSIYKETSQGGLAVNVPEC